MALSSDGKFLAAVNKVNAERRVTIYNSHGEVVFERNIGNMKFDSVDWAGSEFLIVKLRDTFDLSFYFISDKYELSIAIVISIDGRQSEQVFLKSPRVGNAIFGSYGFRFVDGKWLGYFGGLTYRRVANKDLGFDHGRPALFAVDLKQNRPKKVAAAAPEGHRRDWLVDSDGRAAVTFQIEHYTGKWKIENAEGHVIASGTERTGAIDLLSLGKDGSTVIYRLEDKENETERLMEIPLSGGTPGEIFAGTDIRRFFIDRNNGRLMGYLPEKSRKTVLFDPEKQAILDKIYRAFPNLHARVLDWTPTFSHFLVHTSGNGDSGTWYLVDIAKLKADPIGYDRPLIGPKDVGSITTVEYVATDGLEMDGILTLPPGREPKNLPVIMLPHGGPDSQDVAIFDWWAQAFASRGYAVFQPNFRGSTNRDLAFEHAGYGEWGRKMQSDISDGLAELAERGIVDPGRACIVGASYGGYAALAGVTLQQGIYKCAVAVAPVSDVEMMYETDLRETAKNKMVKRSLIEKLGDPKDFDAISPRRFADRADAPILLIHGKDDTRILFKQSKLMADALDDARKPYEFVVLEEEDHFLSRAPTRMQMLDAAMRFVQKHNPAD